MKQRKIIMHDDGVDAVMRVLFVQNPEDAAVQDVRRATRYSLQELESADAGKSVEVRVPPRVLAISVCKVQITGAAVRLVLLRWMRVHLDRGGNWIVAFCNGSINLPASISLNL
ncbi:MAG: hypothetical protein LBP35_06170 [Candidatus Ancillula trichonymphae]|nr:hypothetical protein [Candidatus Ancillula trichonymphae]